jgi:hypothetical protein
LRLETVLDQMAERAVAQPEHEIANISRCLGVQFSEDFADQALIVFNFFGFYPIAHKHWGHGRLPLGLSRFLRRSRHRKGFGAGEKNQLRGESFAASLSS